VATGCAGGRGSCWWRTTAPSVGSPSSWGTDTTTRLLPRSTGITSAMRTGRSCRNSAPPRPAGFLHLAERTGRPAGGVVRGSGSSECAAYRAAATPTGGPPPEAGGRGEGPDASGRMRQRVGSQCRPWRHGRARPWRPAGLLGIRSGGRSQLRRGRSLLDLTPITCPERMALG